MRQDHNPQHSPKTDGQESLRDCPAFERLSQFFDDQLDAFEADSVRDHVRQCSNCQAVLRDLSLIRRSLVATTPAAPERSFRLTLADVESDLPSRLPTEPVTTGTERKPAKILTFPFVPALTAVAALLLLAVITGDLVSRENGPNPTPTPATNSAFSTGSPVVVTDEDREDSFSAAGDSPTNPDSSDQAAENAGERANDNSFWDWWRISELLLLAVLIGLVTTTVLQRRSRRA